MIPTGRAQNAGRVAGVYTTVLPPFERFLLWLPVCPPAPWSRPESRAPCGGCCIRMGRPGRTACGASPSPAPRLVASPRVLAPWPCRHALPAPRSSGRDSAGPTGPSELPDPLRLRVLCCPKLSPAEPPSRRPPEPHLRSASSLGAQAIRLPVPSAPPRVGRPGSAPFTFPPPRHPINSTRLGLSVAPRLHCRPQRGGQGRPGITSEPTAFPRLLVECSVCYKCSACFIFLENRGEKNPAIH